MKMNKNNKTKMKKVLMIVMVLDVACSIVELVKTFSKKGKK